MAERTLNLRLRSCKLSRQRAIRWVKVDAALIEQLRAGYAQLSSKGAPLALQAMPA
jgi:hypothetical protein